MERTIASIDARVFADPEWTEELAVECAAEYLRNLDGHLRGTRTTAYWSEYYRLAADCNRSAGRVVAQGIVNHLVDDLPRTIKAVGTTDADHDDYQLYGQALVEATPRIVSTFKAHHGTDLSPLFQLYFVGDLVGSGTVTTLFFTTVRNVAWSNRLVLRRSTLLGNAGIAGTWTAASTAVAVLERTGKL